MKIQELKKGIEKELLNEAYNFDEKDNKKLSKAHYEKRHNLASDILLNPSIFASKFMKVYLAIESKEKSRLEIVVNTEVEDFIRGRESFNLISKNLVGEMIEGIIDRLENNPMNYEVVLIDRQHFLVNYEMINRCNSRYSSCSRRRSKRN